MILCQEMINLNTTISTYCMLKKGHTGEHSSLEQQPQTTPKRCQSVSKLGKQCGLPDNHYGMHSSGLADRTW